MSKDYQKFVKDISTKKVEGEEARIDWAIKEMVAEAGEVLGLSTKATRKGLPIDRDKLYDELSDTLWGLVCVLNEAFPDYTLQDLMVYNTQKLSQRYADPEKLKEIS